MPEYWFKYGVTETFVEISEEIAQGKIQPDIIGSFMDVEGRIADFLDEFLADRNLNLIQILYDHPGDLKSLNLLKALIERFLKLKPDGNVIFAASSWRLDPEIGRKHLNTELRRLELNLTLKAFLKKGDPLRIENLVDKSIPIIVAVSYTHLTLPTICSV